MASKNVDTDAHLGQEVVRGCVAELPNEKFLGDVIDQASHFER